MYNKLCVRHDDLLPFRVNLHVEVDVFLQFAIVSMRAETVRNTALVFDARDFGKRLEFEEYPCVTSIRSLNFFESEGRIVEQEGDSPLLEATCDQLTI